MWIMYDIIRCDANPSEFGYEKFFKYDKSKIIEAPNLQAAVQFKNKKSLILLKDYAFDEGAIKVIAEKKKLCFLIDLGRLIRSSGIPRAIAMSKLRTFLKLCVKYGAFYSFVSFANSPSKIRTASELSHIAMLFDLNRGQAEFSLKMLPHYM